MRFRRHQEAAAASTRRLLLLFALLLVALIVAVNLALALAYKLTMPFVAGWPRAFFETNTALVLLFVLGGCWFETLRLREGGAHVARMAGGRPAQTAGHAPIERLERRFVNVVRELAIATNQPPPAAWVLPRDDAINAFAAGWQADDAVIAVTRGALERLTREELQGVVAHEYSHLAHGDTRLNMRLIGLVWGLQMVFGFGRMLSAPDETGRRPVSLLVGWALMAVGSLGWAAGRLLQAAVSRQREFLADASAVKYTRVVAGIGGALRKIAAQQRAHADRLAAAQVSSLAHLLLAMPRVRSAWWATHPPIGERLRRLYGSDPGPLPAEPPAAPIDDEPLLALAPARAAARRASGDEPVVADAERHDATQNPALLAAEQREREALQRIERWHGPGERAAALIALVGAPFDGTAGERRWSDAAGGLHVAEAVRREVDALDRSRVEVLCRIARRGIERPAAERRALLRATAPLADAPLRQLRWLVLRQQQRPQARAWPARGRELAALHAHALRASAFVALALGGDDPAGWWTRCCAALVAQRVPRPQPPPRVLWCAALRLQRTLAPMQRPLLWRAWRDATPLPHGAEQREALALLAVLLQLPLDEVAAQARSL